MANETTQKLGFVAVLGALVAGAAYFARAPRVTVPQTVGSAKKPEPPKPEPKSSKAEAPAPSSAAPPPSAAPSIPSKPIDRLVDLEIPPTGCSDHQFGESLAALDDTLLVGAPWRDYAVQKAAEPPAACLYRREGDTWSLTQKLVADEPKKSEGFARAVALTESFVVVGAAGHENGDGPTHDYQRTKGKAKLRSLLAEPSGELEIYEEYGAAVASNERLVLVGAHLFHNPKCGECGAVHVFLRDQKKPTLLEGEAPGENLGTAIALSGDLVVIGAAGYYSSGKKSGAALVMRLEGERFRTICRLPGSIAAEEYGASVAIDGRFVVVGAHAGPRFTVHEVQGDTCIPRGEFVSAGASVAISGEWIAAGQPGFDGGAKSSGRVALFHLAPDGSLEHRAWLLPKRVVERGWFGSAVALTRTHVFAGAPGMRDDGSAFVAGARL